LLQIDPLLDVPAPEDVVAAADPLIEAEVPQKTAELVEGNASVPIGPRGSAR
jgi:hypothetical protein